MRATRLPAAAAALLLALALTGCDALDAALGDTDADGSSDPAGVDLGGPGGPEDWLRVVCGRDADIVEEEPDNSEYRAHRTRQLTCTVPGTEVGDSEVEAYEVVAAVYSEDPDGDLVDEADTFQSGNGNELAWAYAELDDGWAVVWLYPDWGTAQESVLEPLEKDGFEVGSVDSLS